MNGAYAISYDGTYVNNAPNGITHASGESLFFKPWVGVDDFGSILQNDQVAAPNTGTAGAGRHISIRNFAARNIVMQGF